MFLGKYGLSTHRALLEGTHPEIASLLRTQALWIGGNPETITELFAESTFPPRITAGPWHLVSVRHRQAFMRHWPQLNESMRSTVDLLAREPALTAEMFMELTNQSSSSAYRNISTLESLGALKPNSHIKGRQVWIAPAIIEALDEFALRAGKRIRG